ncbi:MAG: hypothetical protein Q9170_008157 [Blastenia crenularia]
MFLLRMIRLLAIFGLYGLYFGSALPDLPLPSLPDNATNGTPLEFDLGPLNATRSTNERPVRYSVPGAGNRVTLYLDWHLTRFEQRETDLMILRALDRLVQTAISMSKGDEPLLNGRVVFRSPSLKLTARDKILLGGFTYSTLATAIRGLGEIMYDWGATGVDVDVYVIGKMVGSMEFDFII